MSRPRITLLTDFGQSDAYVGIMKGVIAGRCDADLIDLTHYVEPGDIPAAAYLLATAWPYFPQGTVHVAVVDPGVGSDRRILAVEHAGQRFLAPDNGLLTPILQPDDDDDDDDQSDENAAPASAPPTVVHVTCRDLFLPRVSRTFHGRDVFAPVAAALANGTAVADLGPPAETFTTLPGRPLKRSDDRIEGRIIHVDRFGNLVTNIRARHLPPEAETATRLTVHVGSRRIHGLAPTYASVEPGTLIGLIGSTDRLEISIAAASAADQLDLAVGHPVTVQFHR